MSPRLGIKLRDLRRAKGLTLRDLAVRVGVGFTYLSKIENDKLERGHAPSEELVETLARELDGDENELLLLAGRIPAAVANRIFEKPEVFLRLAQLDDQQLEQAACVGSVGKSHRRRYAANAKEE